MGLYDVPLSVSLLGPSVLPTDVSCAEVTLLPVPSSASSFFTYLKRSVNVTFGSSALCLLPIFRDLEYSSVHHCLFSSSSLPC